MNTILEPSYIANPKFKDNHLNSSNEIDFWDTLPQFVQKGIVESQKQYKEGKFTKFSEVKASILARKHRE